MTYLLEQQRPAPGLQRRRDARRRQDAHLVRHRMGLRLRRRHPRPAEVGRRADRRRSLRGCCRRMGRSCASPKPQLREYEREAGAAGEALRARLRRRRPAPSPIRTRSPSRRSSRTSSQVSPHLFKFKRPNFWPNFGLILADSGRALVVDCGLLDEQVPRRRAGRPARALRLEGHRRRHHHPHARRPFPGSAAPAREVGRADLGARQHGGQDGAPGVVRLRRAHPGLRQEADGSP